MKKTTIAHRSTLLATTLAVALAGCSTVNPYTGEKQTAKATSGAAIGAVAGAAVGALAAKKGDRGKGALIGAGVGAATGGGIGYYMDVQEAKLRQKLEGSGVGVTRDGNNIILNMPGNVTFASGSSNLNSGFFNTLDSVAIVLAEYKKTRVTVAGHTDNVGKDSKNQILSEQRATTVASYLKSQGVDPQRFSVIGYGESAPIASNDTPSGRQQNRRVEIRLDPIEQ